MKELSEVARCAKAIRIELKKAYPDTKFSVTSESFSMGNAVRIHWTDGVAELTIRDIIDKYKDGDFEMLDDSYNHRKDNGLPRAKYITTSRSISEHYYEKALQAIKQHHCYDFLVDLDTTSQELFERRKIWTGRNLVYRSLIKMDLTAGMSTKQLLTLT